MSINAANTYDIDPLVAELYDQLEQTTDDLELIRRLVPAGAGLRILEPFCGSARLAVALAGDGHEVVGVDQSACMLARARDRIDRAPPDVRARLTLREADAVASTWPVGFDVVILGINSFYELGTSEEQEGCIAAAAAATREGGHVYVDNNHMEGLLDEHWRTLRASGVFPTGRCADGTRLDGSIETTWADPPGRRVRFRRTVRITRPDGDIAVKAWEQQVHPPSTGEVSGWLARHGFTVERLVGDHAGAPYSDASPRAIFWARRTRS
jgi:SAM-dependent methyltransferase